MESIASLITPEAILQWTIILILFVYFIYKEYPEFKRRITTGVAKEQKAETTTEQFATRLDMIEKRLDAIDEKLDSDYASIRQLETADRKSRKLLSDSLEEREIIMRALLGIIGGLQEIGADGPTKESQTEITNYLAKQAHKDDIDF